MDQSYYQLIQHGFSKEVCRLQPPLCSCSHYTAALRICRVASHRIALKLLLQHHPTTQHLRYHRIQRPYGSAIGELHCVLLTCIYFRVVFSAFLIAILMADVLLAANPKRGLGANDDIKITVCDRSFSHPLTPPSLSFDSPSSWWAVLFHYLGSSSLAGVPVPNMAPWLVFHDIISWVSSSLCCFLLNLRFPLDYSLMPLHILSFHLNHEHVVPYPEENPL